MMEFNTLPGWLGWVATAIIVLGTIYMFYRQRKRKRETSRTHRWWPMDGFGTLWIPLDIEKEDAEAIAHRLWAIQQDVWDMCKEEYLVSVDWYIDRIGLGHVAPSEDHQNIQYHPGVHKMEIKIQDSMYYHFAGECHNVYRSFLWGPLYIDEWKNADDLLRKGAVDDRIEEAYR